MLEIMYNAIFIIHILIASILSDEISNDTIANSSVIVTNTDIANSYENESFEVTLIDQSIFNESLLNETITNLTEIKSPVIEEIDNAFKWNLDSNYLSYTMPDENICVCDLNSNACDINCCCDLDCNEDDIKVFSKCDPQTLFMDENYCYFTDIILRNSTVYQVQTNPKNGLLCIVHNNLRQYLRFKDLPTLSSQKDLDLILKYQSKEIFSWDTEDKKEDSSKKQFKAGSLIFINNSHIETAWSLPASCFTGLCSCDRKVFYLEDFSSSCIQTVTNLEEECKNSATWSADSLNFCISFQKTFTNSLFVQSKEINSNDEAYSEVNRFCLESDKKTYFSNNICYNVISSVHYSVLHDGIFGIKDITHHFVFMDITSNNQSFVQNFKVNFTWYNSSEIMKKSGNPGYLVGLPILAGTNKSHSAEELYEIEMLTDGLSVFSRNSKSQCDGLKRQTVKFGKNLKSNCYFNLTELDCKTAQERLHKILLGSNNENIYVGIFGNANTSNSDDWIEAYYDKNEYTYAEDTCKLMTGLKIDIIYSAVGTIQNPQFKILGLGYHYTKSLHVETPCIKQCNIILSTSVSFFDVTDVALPHYPKIPTLKAKLPIDFFYPFLQGS